MKRNKRIIVIIIVLLVGLAAFVLFFHKSSNVNLFISPGPAKVIVDNSKQVQAGTFYLAPGKHTFKASFEGFYNKTINFTATTNLQTLNILLEPSTQVGFDWLKNHPDDARARQKVGGEQYNQAATQLLREFPIVAKLPYQGPGGEYAIGYGSLISNKLGIDITFYTTAGKQSALEWLQSQGYDMSTFSILYIDKTYQPPVVNNPYTN